MSVHAVGKPAKKIEHIIIIVILFVVFIIAGAVFVGARTDICLRAEHRHAHARHTAGKWGDESTVCYLIHSVSVCVRYRLENSVL